MPHIKLEFGNLETIRTVDPRLMSYNVEMTEVTGGTFWKAYTPGQIDGTEQFPPISRIHEMANLMQWYDPIESTNPRLRKLAKEFGPVWVRVSGTWATKTYYDFEDTGVVPEGYQNRMTKQQWLNILDFVDAVGGKLLISVANCEGLHSAVAPWNPSQAEKIFALSKELGCAFLDTDDVIIRQNGCPLRDILDREGVEGFKLREEEAICSVEADRTIIATGGLGSILAPHCRHAMTVDPALVLKGLALIWRKTKEAEAKRLHR